MKMALAIKLTFLRPPFESDHLEAQKTCFYKSFGCKLNVAFSANDQFQFTNLGLHIFSWSQKVRELMAALAVWNHTIQ